MDSITPPNQQGGSPSRTQSGESSLENPSSSQSRKKLESRRRVMSDAFMMKTYKIKMCKRTDPHNWRLCPYAHPGEAGRRRPSHTYQAVMCDFTKSKECPHGESCRFARNALEYYLHPDKYRTTLCGHGESCTRNICFFAHNQQELRIVKKTASAAGAGAGAAKASTAEAAQLLGQLRLGEACTSGSSQQVAISLQPHPQQQAALRAGPLQSSMGASSSNIGQGMDANQPGVGSSNVLQYAQQPWLLAGQDAIAQQMVPGSALASGSVAAVPAVLAAAAAAGEYQLGSDASGQAALPGLGAPAAGVHSPAFRDAPSGGSAAGVLALQAAQAGVFLTYMSMQQQQQQLLVQQQAALQPSAGQELQAAQQQLSLLPEVAPALVWSLPAAVAAGVAADVQAPAAPGLSGGPASTIPRPHGLPMQPVSRLQLPMAGSAVQGSVGGQREGTQLMWSGAQQMMGAGLLDGTYRPAGLEQQLPGPALQQAHWMPQQQLQPLLQEQQQGQVMLQPGPGGALMAYIQPTGGSSSGTQLPGVLVSPAQQLLGLGFYQVPPTTRPQ